MNSTPLAEATAGAISAVFSNTLVFPLDVIKTRLQVQTKQLQNIQKYNSISHAFYSILKKEGISGLYKGFGSGSLGTIVATFSYFFIYSSIRGHVVKSTIGKLGTSMELIIGALAGALCQFIVLPIAIITTRQQTASESDNIIKTIHSIFETDGFQGFWKGLKASLVLCVNPAITYGVFERLKGLWIERLKVKSLTSIQVFIIGAISKTLATIVTYPYIMAKVRLQWSPPKDNNLSTDEIESMHYTGSFDVLKKVYSSEGIEGIYKGISAQILKAVLSQAILFVTKEHLTVYTMKLLYSFSVKNKIVSE